MKRGSAASAPPGRDVDLGSRPVETTQHEAVSRTTAIKIPRAQGVWIALPFTVAVAPIIVGPRIFYGVMALASIAAFLWSVQFEMKWQRLGMAIYHQQYSVWKAVGEVGE